MRFKLVILFLFIGLISCNNKGTKIEKSKSTNFSITKDISALNPTNSRGNKTNRSVYILDSRLDFTNLVKNGNENNLFENDTLIWFNIYSSKSKRLLEEREIFFSDKKEPLINQYITYSSEGKILRDNSSYIDLKISDTIKLGKSIHYAIYKGNVDENRYSIIASIENTHDDNIKRIDSFLGNKETNKVKFRVVSNVVGKKNIKGFILQEHMKKIMTSDTFGKITIYKTKILFNKNVFVTY
jgi:hypothetical protein